MSRIYPQMHHRRSIRLPGYDYSQAGSYFVTICAQDSECLFGDVVDGMVVLNDAGRMVQTVWDELPKHYPGVQLDEYIVMPNHFHGIVSLVGAPLPFTGTTGRHRNNGRADIGGYHWGV